MSSRTDCPGHRQAYRLADVDHIYPSTGTQALSGISLDLPAGSVNALIGPSGCGKSTLLSVLAGLLRPTRGEVSLFDNPVTEPPVSVGLMFQQATLLPWRTVMENVLLPLEIRGSARSARQARDRALELLMSVDLAGVQDAYPDELSGGMAQRVAICRMLITSPEVLLLDEPFGALDEFTRERMDLEIQRIAMVSQATVVFVTHSISESVFLADRVFAMATKPGRIAEVIDIDLPRPRSGETMEDPVFAEYVVRVRQALNKRFVHG